MGLNVHLAILRRAWIFLAIWVGLLFAAPTARAQDPVEKLRQALLVNTGEPEPKIELLVKRRKMIEASLADLTTISQLRRAYFLREWLTQAEFDKVGGNLAIDRFRIEVGARFVKAVNLRAQDSDSDVRIPVASMIAEMADADQPTERRGQGKFARVFTKTALSLAKDEDILVRQYGLSALGKITPKPGEVIPLLKRTLKTDALGPRRFAAYALGDLVKNTPYLKTVEDERKRGAENDELQTIQQAADAAADGLRDVDERTRGYCLQAILEAAKALNDHLGASSQPLVQLEKGKRMLNRDVNAVLQTMQAINPAVLERFRDPQMKVRLTALSTMDQLCLCRGKLIQTLQTVALEKSIGTLELFQTVDAADPLGNIVRGDWKQVVSLMQDDDVRLRRGAIDILEQLGDQADPAADDIARALSDPDRWVRWTAARSLRHLAPKKINTGAVRALGVMLSDPDADLSAAAADTLAELGPHATEAVDALIVNVLDGDAENRIKAMHALVRIGSVAGERATPKLIETLSDPDARVRRAAAETLGQFGPSAKAALSALRAAMRDSDPAVRLNASEAILSIAPPRKKL